MLKYNKKWDSLCDLAYLLFKLDVIDVAIEYYDEFEPYVDRLGYGDK